MKIKYAFFCLFMFCVLMLFNSCVIIHEDRGRLTVLNRSEDDSIYVKDRITAVYIKEAGRKSWTLIWEDSTGIGKDQDAVMYPENGDYFVKIEVTRCNFPAGLPIIVSTFEKSTSGEPISVRGDDFVFLQYRGKDKGLYGL